MPRVFNPLTDASLACLEFPARLLFSHRDCHPAIANFSESSRVRNRCIVADGHRFGIAALSRSPPDGIEGCSTRETRIWRRDQRLWTFGIRGLVDCDIWFFWETERCERCWVSILVPRREYILHCWSANPQINSLHSKFCIPNAKFHIFYYLLFFFFFFFFFELSPKGNIRCSFIIYSQTFRNYLCFNNNIRFELYLLSTVRSLNVIRVSMVTSVWSCAVTFEGGEIEYHECCDILLVE